MKHFDISLFSDFKMSLKRFDFELLEDVQNYVTRVLTAFRKWTQQCFQTLSTACIIRRQEIQKCSHSVKVNDRICMIICHISYIFIIFKFVDFDIDGAVVHSLLKTCSRSCWASYYKWTFMAYLSFYCLCDPHSVCPDTHVINYYGTCLHVRGFYFYMLFFYYQVSL